MTSASPGTPRPHAVVDVFVELAKELAAALEERGVDCVAGDAVEGFKSAHDVCRLIIDGAVLIVRRRTGRDVRNYDFLLDGWHEPSSPGSIVVRLDEVALERKLAAARGYPERRVTEGRYAKIIRYRDHVHPVAMAIEDAAGDGREPCERKTQ